MLKSVRWLMWAPLAFTASVLAGAAATCIGEFADGSAWYVWLISGTASAWAFFYVALRIAPRLSAFVKWASVVIVGTLGLMAALGPLLKGIDRARALAGAAMAIVAIYYARLPVNELEAEVGLDSPESRAV